MGSIITYLFTRKNQEEDKLSKDITIRSIMKKLDKLSKEFKEKNGCEMTYLEMRELLSKKICLQKPIKN